MNLQQATQWASDAAAAGDLDSLTQALTARAGGIAALIASPPTAELAGLLAQAIEAGNALDRDVAALKLRIAYQSARLSQVQSGFIAGLLLPRDSQFDIRG